MSVTTLNKKTDVDIKLEDGIKMPPAASVGRGAKPKYPFADMKVGQSFLVPDAPKGITSTMRTAENRIGGGVKFEHRKFDDGSARIWRTA